MRRYNYFDDDPIDSGKDIDLQKIVDETVKLAKRTVSKVKAAIENAQYEAEEDTKSNNAAANTNDSTTHSNTDLVTTAKKIIKGIIPKFNNTLLKLSAFFIFVIIIFLFIVIFNHTINSLNNRNQQFCIDAGNVCTDCIVKHGATKVEALNSEKFGSDMARISGLCYARQMDFNNDGKDELMLCYSENNTYTLEIWSYVKKDFTKVYSEKANSTNNEKDGSWIAFYYKNKNYYICKTEINNPEKVTLLRLRNGEFEENDVCDYDYKNNIYSFDGEINANDFETIKLSAIKTSRAERIAETTLDNISKFDTISIATLNKQKTEEQLRNSAYSEIIEKRIEQYGEAKICTDDNDDYTYLDGVSLARLVDFNADGKEELLLVYRKLVKNRLKNTYNNEYIVVEEPTYYIEVYSWNGTVANKIFSRSSISNLFGDKDTNYIILKKNKKTVQICSNSYDFTSESMYTATSKIFTCKEYGFDTTYSSKMIYSYGYRDYYVDNEYVYSYTFENEGYKVPRFLNDDAKYNKDKYEFIYFSGNDTSNYNEIIRETNKLIDDLKK